MFKALDICDLLVDSGILRKVSGCEITYASLRCVQSIWPPPRNKGMTTRNKKLLGAKGMTTRSKKLRTGLLASLLAFLLLGTEFGPGPGGAHCSRVPAGPSPCFSCTCLRCWHISIAFSKPTAPAADSKCPTCILAAVIQHVESPSVLDRCVRHC